MSLSLRPLCVALCLLCVALCSACTTTATAPIPTAIPAAEVPTFIPAIAQRGTVKPAPLPEMTATPTEVAVVMDTAVFIPTPEGNGIQPDEAQQFFVPDAGPEAPADWRPPPYEAPLSIHPDEHYWLLRPIPSGNRNYGLEWYPFGNDVMLPELAPYRIHHGEDFPNDPGTPVLAAGSGTVIHAGPLPSPRNGVNYYGNTIIIKHDWQWNGQDVYTLYAHTLELFVQPGDYVEAGQLLAGVGNSGQVSGPHLHLEVRVGDNNYASARNPALWLVPFEGWGTLAGRLVDKNGRLISDALVTVTAVNGQIPVRVQRTYYPTVAADPVWRENFVVGDLPAGEYTLRLDIGDRAYRRSVTIYPGRTTFEIISTEFEFIPTPTPLPTPTLTTTVGISSTLPITATTPTP
ncbi:MAG: peptidoglycan DD-metalloendopeptidase family protein [Ardenticatenaceae bacterium]|nr:peptidoglycan DD-metalloendopeptidase family protein [Ardenticatenaceae bacterium]